MASGFLDIALIVILAAVFGFTLKALKQPTILAYILAGVAIGYFNLVGNAEPLKVFSELGVVLLLFLVGLEINFSALNLVSKPSIIIGLLQMAFTFALALLLAGVLHISHSSALYLAAAITFSSTIIVVKLLSEKKDIGSLHGKISVGVLLVQDLIAILVLMLVENAYVNQAGKNAVLMIAGGILVLIALLIIGRKLVSKVFSKISRSNELLFISSIAWMFVAALITKGIGLSMEIGGLIAGVAIANSIESLQIAGKIRPLRDFFVMIFFVMLGASMSLPMLGALWPKIIILLLFVLIIKPVIIMAIMGILGYRKRTSFMVGVSLAQISEFSLILAALGLRLGHIDQQTAALITAVGILSIIFSSYYIVFGEKIYKKLSWILSIFEKIDASRENYKTGPASAPIVIVGFQRTGKSIAGGLDKKDLLIVDFDPDAKKYLDENGYKYIFGDISDSEICREVDFKKTKLVVSTVPDLNHNLSLISHVKKEGGGCKIIARAENEKDAGILYRHGADYVLVPNITAGHVLGSFITLDSSLDFIGKLRAKI
ncbi:MAG: sodium/hydrogen exchanger [Parcubacteria group bacterium Licking1014_17]|nr:MAG: sodium/hydrogen exchanger [Parcubacteria group bacterium Licking1014_17]